MSNLEFGTLMQHFGLVILVLSILAGITMYLRARNKRKQEEHEERMRSIRAQSSASSGRTSSHRNSRYDDRYDEDGIDVEDVLLAAAVVSDVAQGDEYYEEPVADHVEETEPQLTDEQMEQNVRDAIAESTPVQESTSIPEPVRSTPSYEPSYSSSDYSSSSSSYDSGSSDSGGGCD